MDFQDVIEILLKKKADLRAQLEREFAERSNKIDELLTVAGYVEPVPVEEAPVEVENGVQEGVFYELSSTDVL